MRPAVLLASLGLTLVAGCGALPTPPASAPVSTYRLAPTIPPGSDERASEAVLAVSRPTASPAFATPRLAYQQRDFEVRYYASNEWVAAPADMLERVLVDALAASGRFVSVVGDADTRLAGRRLDVDIREMTHDLRGATANARIALRAQLIDAERGALIAAREFAHVQALEDAGPYAGVQGLNAALTALLPALVDFASER